MVKILEYQKGLIDVYNGYACTTSFCVKNDEAKKWFIQNYINYITRYNSKNEYVFSDYFYSDFTYNSAINFFQPENIVNLPYVCYSAPSSEVDNIINFIHEKINTGFYICLFVNLKYLDAYCQKDDLVHDIFIYGYDDERQIIYSTGYTNGKKYSSLIHSYDEICLAYKNVTADSPEHRWFDTKRISFFKPRENFVYDFNTLDFTEKLKEYLNIEVAYQKNKRLLCPNSDRNDEKVVYGIESIKVLIHFFENITKSNQIDLRQLYFFFNHKVNMRYKIRYLLDNGYLDDSYLLDEYDKIVDFAQRCLNISIKYKMKQNNICLKKIVFYLKQIYEQECCVLKKLIKTIKNE